MRVDPIIITNIITVNAIAKSAVPIMEGDAAIAIIAVLHDLL